MILIVGLGNPGKKFQKTRHNLGFEVVDEFAKKNNFPDFKFDKNSNALISKKTFGKEKIILAKPQTFMNFSGKATKNLLQQYRINSAMAELIRNLIVIHDDLDISLGKIKISKGHGAAGHKGVESIIKELRTKNFIRFRVGIQPITYNLQLTTVEKFVLQKFNKGEEKIVKEIIKKTAEAIEFSLREGLTRAMAKFN